MAITKKSLIGKASTKKTTNSKTSAAKAAGPVTPGKMVPAMRLGKTQLMTAKAGLATSKRPIAF
jgi:hypothetical protein